MTTDTIKLIPLLLTLLVATPSVHADLLAYEGFDYTVGSKLTSRFGTADGGIGFAGPWRAGGFNAAENLNFEIGENTLDFGKLQVSGNRLRSAPTNSIAGITRDLATPLGTPGTTRYLSYVIRPDGPLGQGAFDGFFGITLESPSDPQIFIGKPGGGQTGRVVLENRGGSNQVATTRPWEPDDTLLLVVQADFRVGSDSFGLYVDPIPGQGEPTSFSAVTSGNVSQVNGLTVYSSGSFSIDEIRVGETFDDVVPVPEPSSGIVMILLALSAGATIRRRG